MNILDQFEIQQKYEEAIAKLVHALLAFRVVFLKSQRTIDDATLHTFYKNSTSTRFIVELSIYFVDFQLQF